MDETFIQSEYEEALKRYNNLKNQMINIIEDKEYLLRHKFFDLKANYITRIGYLEYELNSINIKLGLMKRKIELAQLAINNNVDIDLLLIETEVKKEFEEYLNVLDIKAREIEVSNYLMDLDTPTETEMKDLKKYFKAIAKLLSPEINLDLNPVHKKLWEKAIIAYENGEVQYLKIICKLANDQVIGQIKNEDLTLEELNRRIKYFEDKISLGLDEIKSIVNHFPFNKEEILKNDEMISNIQGELKRNIKEGNNILNIMEDCFLMMMSDTKYIN